MRPFLKQFTGDQKIDENLRRIGAAYDAVLKSPLLAGSLIEGVSLLSGQSNFVSHGLGRTPRGFIVVSPDADARIWKGPSDSPSTTLVLNTSANVNLSVFVF